MRRVQNTEFRSQNTELVPDSLYIISLSSRVSSQPEIHKFHEKNDMKPHLSTSDSCLLTPDFCANSTKLNRNRTFGFSLIELLTVTAIISILAGMIGVAAHSARIRAYSTLARMEAQQIATAFKSYWVTKGKWPSGYDGGGGYDGPLTKAMLFASDLMGGGTGPNAVTSSPFLEISDETFGGGEEYLDPWGHPYTVKIDPTVEVEQPETFQVVVGFINAERYYYQD